MRILRQKYFANYLESVTPLKRFAVKAKSKLRDIVNREERQDLRKDISAVKKIGSAKR